MEIAAEVWSSVGPKATGTARFGGELRRHGACIQGQKSLGVRSLLEYLVVETLQWEVASRALALGINVILDYGFWAREEREDFRARAKQLGARSEVHFLDVGEQELLRCLEQRNAQPSSLAFHIPEEMMRPWIASFQKPTPDELQRRD